MARPEPRSEHPDSLVDADYLQEDRSLRLGVGEERLAVPVPECGGPAGREPDVEEEGFIVPEHGA